MQKLVQRVKYAERHRARQLKAKNDRGARIKDWQNRGAQRRLRKEDIKVLLDARQNRREDWESGALAPRRDVGEHADTYGARNLASYVPPSKPEEQRRKWIPFRKGDRVVVTKGRERGRIGKVEEVMPEMETLHLQDINMHDLVVPKWLPRDEGDTRKVVSTPFPLSLDDVKLVYPLPDPETGVLKDTVIDRLIPKAHDRALGPHDKSASRVIPGTNTIIPWPVEADPDKTELEDNTHEPEVESDTFQPHLLYPPMPTSVIDELRNKYSKYRTRHEWDFLQKMEKIDEEAERKKDLGKTMRTPLQELAELRARQKAAEEKELSQEQLAKIGEVMALERAKATEAAKRLAR